MANHVLKEYHLSTNDRYEPKVSTDMTALGVLLVRLLLLDPGTDPVRPEMGVGLPTRYRYMLTDDNNLVELKKDILNQINIYLAPYASNVSVALKVIDKELFLSIKIEEIMYNFVTEEQEDNRVTITQLLGQTE